MIQENLQDSLFEDPVGLRFRHAREKLRWSLESAAQQLKLPVAVLDAIEREDWPRLGAPIFVRSYVGSYAKLLGLPAAVADDVIRGKPQPQLASIGNVAPRRRLDRRLGGAARMALVLAALAALGALAWYLRSGEGRALYGIL